MDQQKQREIASKGGQAAHAQGTAHEFTREEAQVAGRKGGEVVSQNRQHMSEIGRRGGEASSAARREAARARKQSADSQQPPMSSQNPAQHTAQQ